MTDKTEAMEHVIHSSMPIDFERRYAMDNLIAQDADLIETLLEVGRDGVWKSGHNPATAHPMCVKAADRIKALEAENARLRERVKRVENNNRELRGSKERVYAATDLRRPTQSDAEITETDCNVAEYIAGDRARDLDYQVVAYHREWSVLEERAKIVAWLRRLGIMRAMRNPSQLADDIEAGEHLK